MKSKQDYIREKIRHHIDAAKEKNPRFSLRAFASKVKMNSGILSSFLKGDRGLSYENLEKILYHVIKDPQERHQILKSHNQRILEELTSKQSFVDDTSRELTVEEFSSVLNWYYFAFLALIHTEDFKLDIDWISSRLGISKSDSIDVIAKCLELGLITVENNKVKRTSQKVRSKDNDPILKDALKEHHQQFLQQSIKALQELPQAKRDITAITLPINPKNFEKSREIIRKFQDDMEALLEDGEKTEVYRLCVQLYPITKYEQ